MGAARKQKVTQAAGFRFGNDHGDRTTLLAVAAPIEKASPAVAAVQRLAVRPNVYGQRVAAGHLGWQFAGSPFTHYLFRWWEPSEVADLSKRLGTMVILYYYEDTSGWRGFRAYDKGKCVESYEWGLGDEPEEGGRAKPKVRTFDGKPLHHHVLVQRSKEFEISYDYRFRSERRKVPASMVSDHDRMLEEACRFYGVLMPEYGRIPCSEEAYEPEKGDEEQYVRVDLLVTPTAEDMAPADFQLKEALAALDAAAVREAIVGGANVHEVAGTEHTPMELVTQGALREPEKAAEVIRALVAAGVRADVPARKEVDIPLLDMLSGLNRASAKLIPAVEALLDAGTDVNAIGRGPMMKGQTALHKVAHGECPALVLFLLSRGANPNKKNRSGRTPRRAAEGKVRFYEKGWPGAEKGIPKLRRIIEYLSAAEQGKAPVRTWEEEYALDVAADKRERRKTRAGTPRTGRAKPARKAIKRQRPAGHG